MKDPKSFHEAHGHPSDEVTRMLCMTYYGNANAVKGYADSCPYCLSRRRRIQPRQRTETIDRTQYRMGESWSMDFTPMCLRRSHHDLNQVGVLFREYISHVKVGQALKNHTEICIALDFLWNYILTEQRGVRLLALYAYCDPIWFSTDELKIFLRKVGRWCFIHAVMLFINVPGQSQQNGGIEGDMGRVMSLTSVQLSYSFLNELFWDRSFLLAIFVLWRMCCPRSRSSHVRDSWNKIPDTVWTGRIDDLTVLICAFGQALILKNDRKNNRYTRQGELGYFMRLPWKSKGWLIWNVVQKKYQVRYNIRVITSMMWKPVVSCLNKERQ